MGFPKARRSLATACRAGQAGRLLIWLTLFASAVIVILIFFDVIVSGPVFEPVAAAGNGNDLGVMKEPVQDRRGRGNITEQLSPVF